MRALSALNTQGYSQISEEKAPPCFSFTKLPVTFQTAIEMESVSPSRPHIDIAVFCSA